MIMIIFIMIVQLHDCADQVLYMYLLYIIAVLLTDHIWHVVPRRPMYYCAKSAL